MHLAAFFHGDCNYNKFGWRSDEAYADAGLNFARWIEFAQILEKGKFDMLFIADSPSAFAVDDPKTFAQTARNIGFEPFTVASALTMVTTKLGIALTASTTWSEPYTIARTFASLDRISGGRAGWNLVTGRNPEDALNYGASQHVEHAERYRRAEEFIDVCNGLWQSYDEGAFLMDKASGQFVDPDGYHVLNHVGEHFRVKGPLNVPPPVQGKPVIIQAGQSGPGVTLAARVADCVFTSQPTLEDAQKFYGELKSKASAVGRDPSSVIVLPGVTVYVGRTREEALRKLNAVQALTSPDDAIKTLQAMLGIDFSGHDLAEAIPELHPTSSFANPEQLARSARERGMNLGQFAVYITTTMSHNIAIGAPDEIVDQLQLWFESEAADGFILLPPTVPASLNDFVELVIPLLQSRGLFRQDYDGETLRENLGLANGA